jgi:hypothetical protein
MAVVWKLQGGTVAAATPVDELGLSGLVRTRRSLARDELICSAIGAEVDSTALFAYGDEVVLTRTEDADPAVTWFRGVCVQVPRRGSGVSEDLRYIIAGTWWYFENLVFQQNWPTVASSTSRRAMIVAGYSPSGEVRQNTKAFIQDVLDWLIASGTGAVAQYTAGNLPTGFNVPFTRLAGPTCAEALQHIARWQPDAATWFDYTTTPPTFNMKRRSAASDASLDLGDLSEVDITPRNDLKMDRLVIQYVTAGSGGTITLAQEVDPVGTTGREFGTAVVVLENSILPIAAGLAANYRSGLSTLQYAGRIVIEEDECSQSTINPGYLLNITGGLTAWETMYAQVSEITEELDTGRTTFVVGPSERMRLDDFIEILKIARNQSDQYGGSVIATGKYKTENQTLTKDFNPAAGIPTFLEIATAIEQAYVGKPAPRPGDTVDVTIDSVLRYTAFPHTSSAGASGDFVVGFIVSSVQYYAHVYNTASWRTITQALTVAGTVPTDAELTTGLQSAFTSTARPHHGDSVILTVGGNPKFQFTVDFKLTSANGRFQRSIVLSGKTCYARGTQLGIY